MEDANLEKNTVDVLNIVRFLAFLMVFCLHATSFAPAGWNDFSAAWLLYTPAWAGVWIFLVLSGYGIGAGFMSGRYSLDNGRDLLLFWWGRLKKIVPMYYFYLIFSVFFVNPQIVDFSKENTILLLKLLVFWYEPEVDAYACMGIVWYLCTLIKLYFVAPVMYWLVRRFLTSKWRGYLVIVILLVGGLGLRLWGRHVIATTGNGAWHIDIYKPFYMNLDLFFGGFCLNACRGKKEQRSVGWRNVMMKFVSVFALIGLVLYNDVIYYQANIEKVGVSSQHLLHNNWLIYQYILPSIYLLVILLIIKVWDLDREYKRSSLSKERIRKNPLRLIDAFPSVMLTCYLFHANFLRSLSGIITIDSLKKVYGIIGIKVEDGSLPLQTHLWHLLTAACLTILFAWFLGLQGKGKRRRS